MYMSVHVYLLVMCMYVQIRACKAIGAWITSRLLAIISAIKRNECCHTEVNEPVPRVITPNEKNGEIGTRSHVCNWNGL